MQICLLRSRKRYEKYIANWLEKGMLYKLEGCVGDSRSEEDKED